MLVELKKKKKENGNGNFLNHVFKSIKKFNVRLWYHTKNNNLFPKFRKELLPEVIKNAAFLSLLDFSRPVFVTSATLSKEESFRECALHATGKRNIQKKGKRK